MCVCVLIILAICYTKYNMKEGICVCRQDTKKTNNVFGRKNGKNTETGSYIRNANIDIKYIKLRLNKFHASDI